MQDNSLIEHELKPFFPDLTRFDSHGDLVRSSIYAEIRSEVDRVLESTVGGSFCRNTSSSKARIRAAAWNIERGTELDRIVDVFREHPVLRDSDVLLLTELDYGMVRSHNRFVARDLAAALDLDYAFAPCYLALNKGSGLESEIAGENSQALHGNALFARFPIREAHSVALPNGKDLMHGKEKRLGCQRAVVAVVEHPGGPFRVVSLHLDAHSSQRHRHQQMKLVLDHLESLGPQLPVLIGGDWNTSTYNSRRAFYSILGYVRRVLMGVHNVIQNHYPHPDRWFERHLFRELVRRGYRYQDLNEPGACTLHYRVEDLAANSRMADWIPQWCFGFITWALQKNEGRCSMKLDWFAGKDIVPEPEHPPRVLGEVHDENNLLSDHDPIVLDFRLSRDGQSDPG